MIKPKIQHSPLSHSPQVVQFALNEYHLEVKQIRNDDENHRSALMLHQKVDPFLSSNLGVLRRKNVDTVAKSQIL
jgi:hypothetical protein